MAEEFKEFEVKILSIDLPAIRARLQEIGYLDRQATINDIYYENPFTRSREVDVRLRSIQSGCSLTVKGPYEGARGRERREEVELPLSSVEAGQTFLRLAGFTEKTRRTLDREYYRVGEVSAEIVFTEEFPPYLEVEGAHDGVIDVCGRLGVDDSEITVALQPYVRPDGKS